MAYKIAVASSDGQNVDLTFGEAERFTIYEAEGTEYHFAQYRDFAGVAGSAAGAGSCGSAQKPAGGGCGSSCKSGGGCGGGGVVSEKVEALADCRCIVCRKIGFQAQKQLERKAISSFDVGCGIDEALEKILFYYDRADKHQSLRKQRNDYEDRN
ncbi:MAG: hypothetical protein J5898_10870 [Lachnospiraceae bacterium]|nr:hypothetical protein [Lachnospiraceae bacterium]